MNVFATALTYAAPSANYRGESELNRAVMQRVTVGRFEYSVVSPEAMRNALRETLRGYGLPCNRERLHNEDQLAVRFNDYPYPECYVDDFFFGYMVAKRDASGGVPKDVAKQRNLAYKRDSILRMNLAVALEPYRHDALLTQSPLTVKNGEAPWQNADTSALLHREVSLTAFQYPFALNLLDCRLNDTELPIDGAKPLDRASYASRGEQYKAWLRYLLKGIAELNGVAGNHARSYFEMAPASIIVRMSDSLVAGYDVYAFKPTGSAPEVVTGIVNDDYAGSEFLFGGRIVREVLSEDERKGLQAKGTQLYRTAAQALDQVARRATGAGFLGAEPTEAR